MGNLCFPIDKEKQDLILLHVEKPEVMLFIEDFGSSK